MSTNIVKCSNCNIVICEVLAFIQNKIDVMNEDSLVRICTTAFSSEEIDNAKSLLFNSVTTSKRKICRKKDGRSQRDLYDVISLFKETDPELTPTFVARDLQKLPPVHFDHVDPTKLLKDILVIQKELQMIKETYVSEDKFNEIKYELYNLKNTSLLNNNFECYVNRKRGGGMTTNSYFLDSGPIGLPHISRAEPNVTHSQPTQSASTSRSTCVTVAASPARIPVAAEIDVQSARAQQVVERVEAADNCTAVSNAHTPPAPAHRGGPGTERGSSMQRQVTSTPAADKTLAKIVSIEGQWKSEKPNEQWVVAQRKRLRNRFSTLEGKARTNSGEKFRAADIRVPLFINNVDRNTSENDISDYIFGKTQVRVTLQKIRAKVQRQYNAYKMLVPSTKLSDFLEDALWPEGVAVRKFIEFKHKHYGSQTRQDSK